MISVTPERLKAAGIGLNGAGVRGHSAETRLALAYQQQAGFRATNSKMVQLTSYAAAFTLGWVIVAALGFDAYGLRPLAAILGRNFSAQGSGDDGILLHLGMAFCLAVIVLGFDIYASLAAHQHRDRGGLVRIAWIVAGIGLALLVAGGVVSSHRLASLGSTDSEDLARTKTMVFFLLGALALFGHGYIVVSGDKVEVARNLGVYVIGAIWYWIRVRLAQIADARCFRRLHRLATYYEHDVTVYNEASTSKVLPGPFSPEVWSYLRRRDPDVYWRIIRWHPGGSPGFSGGMPSSPGGSSGASGGSSVVTPGRHTP